METIAQGKLRKTSKSRGRVREFQETNRGGGEEGMERAAKASDCVNVQKCANHLTLAGSHGKKSGTEMRSSENRRTPKDLKFAHGIR